MTEKLCPFMTKGDRVDLTGIGEDGTKIITQTVTGTAQVPCFRDGCMAWYEAGEYCHLIHPAGGNMTTYSATWVCVKCGYLKRCELTQHDTDKVVFECPPVWCTQGLVYPGTDMEKCEWEMIP